MIARTEAPEKVIAALRAVGDDATPLLRLEVVMPALASLERHRGTHPTVEQGTRIMSVLPLALARGRASIASGGAGMAARLASVGLHAPAAEWEIATLDRILVACAEHELNASTFAARVVASTGADLYAVGAGRALFAVGSDSWRRMRSDRADVRATRSRDAPGGVPGGVQRQVAPAARLRPRDLSGRRSARGAAQEGGRARLRAIAARRLFETALRVEEAVWRRERLRPNLDFYLTVCARMLGFARGLPAAIFAVGRAAGWIAHSLEQYADNRLIRPRMRYRGLPMRHWT